MHGCIVHDKNSAWIFVHGFFCVHGYLYVHGFFYTAKICMDFCLVHGFILGHQKVLHECVYEFLCVNFFGAECIRKTSFHAPNEIIHVFIHDLFYVLHFKVLMRPIFRCGS